MASSASLTTTHLPVFRGLLTEWEASQPAMTGFVTASDAQFPAESLKDVFVAFRTRPPLPSEAADKFHAIAVEDLAVTQSSTVNPPSSTARVPELDKNLASLDLSDADVFCPGISVSSAEPGVFVVHTPGLKWSGPTLTHKTYTADVAFGPETNNDEIYARLVAQNDLLPLALAGGTACVLAYGQTGSGKTYTMDAVSARAARDLFAHEKRISEASLETGSSEDSIFEFHATFIELLGKRAVDLLDPEKKEVVINEDKVGDVRPRVISTQVRSATELQQLITRALEYRHTSATDRNTQSSRSHAVITIRVKNKLIPYAEDGLLILVDLAGSERYEDSKKHTKVLMDQSKENNRTLMNLKDCVRAREKMSLEEGFVHVPWRASKLTMLLKPIFDIESRQRSRTAVIAHVSPHIQDAAHSSSTLAYAAPFRSAPPRPRGPAPYDPKDPRTWNTEHTRKWLSNEFEKRSRKRAESIISIRTKKAAALGKKTDPAELEGLDQLLVDVETMCPAGMTGRALAANTVFEFIGRCTAAATLYGLEEIGALRKQAAEVAGQLSYLALTAKTKKRNAIMKSRNKVDIKETYGAAPGRDTGFDEDALEEFGGEMLMLTQRYFTHAVWVSRVEDATKRARESGVDVSKERENEYRKMIEEYMESDQYKIDYAHEQTREE